jgi:hypothetical protein
VTVSSLTLALTPTLTRLALIARVGIGLSIIFSYPLNFVGLREGALALIGKREQAWGRP